MKSEYEGVLPPKGIGSNHRSTLSTLGGFAFCIDGVLLPAPATRKARALMSFLAMHRGVDTARDRLLETFWPDAEPKNARDNLSTTLSSIRRCLRSAGGQVDALLVATNLIVRWTADTLVDALRFVQLAAEEDPTNTREALELYRGDFLEGDYDEWSVKERERLATLHETVLVRAVRLWRDPEAARRLVARNPYAEEGYATLIEAEVAAGRNAQATALVESCRKALAEVDEKPSPAFEDRFGHIGRRSLDVPTNNLPRQATSFVGREVDVRNIASIVGRCPLVTIVGVGGVGKTRLAAWVGADLIDRFADGVWFADLGSVTDSQLVSGVIAKVLGVRQQEGQMVAEAIATWLKRKKLLLILDNCEHVLETVANLADAIIQACPHVNLLNTSRQRLGIHGEEVVRLAPLDVPPETGGQTSSTALEFGAVELFVDRARSVDKSFALTDDNAPIVGRICRQLDGIPLALELASARVSVLSIANLAQRLSERFKILTGGSRTALPRHKTLLALMEWSYNLLSPQEQALFNRASVFAGGFSLDAAIAVCSGDGISESVILDLLSSLTDKSLVVADTSGVQERYRLLESMRAYAIDKLAASGERDRLTSRHAHYFNQRAQFADEHFGSGSTLASLSGVERELGNYRAALEWALTEGHDEVLGGSLAGALNQLWRHAGLATEGRFWIESALRRLGETEHPLVTARLWLALAWLSSGDRSVDAADRALRLCDSVRDRRGAARARIPVVCVLFQKGRFDEADEVNARALADLRELGDTYHVAESLNWQAAIAYGRGDLATCRDILTQIVVDAKAIGDEVAMAHTLANLAELAFADGQPEQAVRIVNEALEMHLRANNDYASATDYANCAAYHLALGALDEARKAAREGLILGRKVQDIAFFAFAIQHLALIGAQLGMPHRAARLAGFVDGQYKVLGTERQRTEQWCYEKLVTTLRERLSNDEIDLLAAEGSTWSEDRAIEEAMML